MSAGVLIASYDTAMAKKSGKSSSLAAEIAGLYTGPLAAFTPARNALAARLKKAGDSAAADAVRALAKPTPSAWAVNALFRDEASRMRELLALGATARRALQETFTAGETGALREALAAERALRDELRRRAGEILAAGGRPASRTVLDRVGVDLDALALSPAAASAAERGWLDRDLDPPGFEVLSGLRAAPRRPDRRGLRLVPPAPPPTPRREAKEAKEKKGTKARKKGAAAGGASARQAKEAAARQRRETAERERQGRAAAAQRERIARAEATAAAAAEEAETRRREAERAERDAAAAERAAAEAQRRATDARAMAERARQRAERAAAGAARAEAAVDRMRGV